MMPWRAPALLSLLAAVCPAAEFADVHAILAASCIRCHGPDHQKGDLRLDTLDNLRKGGKSGPAVVAGFPEDSALYARASLPQDDPEVMPAKGEHLTQAQLETIAAWIKAGARDSGSTSSVTAAAPAGTGTATAPSAGGIAATPAAPAGTTGSGPETPPMAGGTDPGVMAAGTMSGGTMTGAAPTSPSTGGASGTSSYAAVQAILAESCVQCHGPTRSKGKLRLDSIEAMKIGGKNGPALVPGSPSASLLYQRIILPPDDSDVMPAEVKHLTPAQIASIGAWITSGAQTAATPAPSADPNAVLHPVIPPGQSGPAQAGAPAPTAPWNPASAPDTDLDLLAKGMPPPDARKLDGLKALSIWWRPVCKNGALIELDCRQVPAANLAASLHGLGDLAGRTVWLNLAGTGVTDEELGGLKAFTNLRRLHLERTTISDAGLAQVAGRTDLTYLNLYGTPVTDTGIAKLGTLIHLEQLFLRETKATPEGAARLKEKIPGLSIIFDEDLPTGPLPVGKKKGGKKN